jgi:rod shape-determining protein MreC
VLYDAADPYTRKVIIDKGLAQGVDRRLAGDRRVRRAGPGDARAPADQRGDAGDRPRAGHSRAQHPHRQRAASPTATPAARQRAGAALHGRNADVQPGDLLTTSGVDGVYPPGMPVAKVEKVERRADSAFARISLPRRRRW